NLSQSGLTGSISPTLQNLTQLQELDLSNNSLTGPIPTFLANMKSLSLINLSGNNLNGSVPQALLDRENKGLVLKLGGNPDLCILSSCNPKEKKQFLLPVVASAASLLAIVVIVALIFVLRKKKVPSNSDLHTPRSVPVVDVGHTTQTASSFLSKKIRFTYTEVQEMTNNFERALSEGGFGIVYHGCVNGTQQVAVKVLSQSSSQGYKHFKAEVELLMRVHHINLVSLVGYCDEGEHLALIYEYMPNGDLKQHLSGKRGGFVLSWENRLSVAVDSALVVAGTPGYLDPEYYQTNWLTEKSDIYISETSQSSAMNPPPPRNPNRDPDLEPDTPMEVSSSMNPPPPRNPNPPDLEINEVVESEPMEVSKDDSVSRVRSLKQNPVPYTIPDWSGPPCHKFHLEVLKEGAIVEQLEVHEKGAYMFGRDGLCDFALEHPSISRFHAVIQYKRSGAAYIFDLGSTHGTSVNKRKVDKKVFVDLHVGDVIRFGGSTRLYIFQGPSELMPPEKDLQLIREAKLRMEMSEREASLRRARQQASMADGVSWGMGEDAIEEEEDDVEEITWQTYTGELTPKQEKTKEKVMKRLEKIGHMKKEVAAIRAKDISQGGLTQGQQTQIARNDQRTAELLEELETLEETLNDSIRESLGAKTGKKSNSKKKGTVEDEEEFSSDEDDFYDRTKKKRSTQKGGENQTVETVDSLVDKRDKILKEIEEKNEQLSAEKNKMETENVTEVASGDDPLDAYMTGLSSTIVQDKTAQIQQELSTLQSELDRILYLLKIADPTGEEVKKRELKSQEPKMKESEKPLVEEKNSLPLKPTDPVEHKEKDVVKDLVESSSKPEAEEKTSETAEEKKTTAFVPSKPQWLGSSANKEKLEEKKPATVAAAATDSTDDVDGFVDYKDRKQILTSSGIEGATGLIIRKRKQEDKKEEEDDKSKEKQAEVMAQDAVALLLKHSVGRQSEEICKKEEPKLRSRKKKKAKKVIGTDNSESLDESTDYDSSWVPPKGQSGDGRTSLNDRLGY
ncbi:hypothetical protein AALP_AA6G346500, partial [Arabis alpina]